MVYLWLVWEFEGFELWQSPATSGQEWMRNSQKEQLESNGSLEMKDRRVATYICPWFLLAPKRNHPVHAWR